MTISFLLNYLLVRVCITSYLIYCKDILVFIYVLLIIIVGFICREFYPNHYKGDYWIFSMIRLVIPLEPFCASQSIDVAFM